MPHLRIEPKKLRKTNGCKYHLEHRQVSYRRSLSLVQRVLHGFAQHVVIKLDAILQNSPHITGLFHKQQLQSDRQKATGNTRSANIAVDSLALPAL